MNIVVLDSANLAGEADFPMLDLKKYGWMQFQQLSNEEAIERCWRADIIISAAAPVNQAMIDKAFKLKLIVAAGENTGHIDTKTAQQRGITICNTPGLLPHNPAHTAPICQQVIANIDAFLKNKAVNVIW